MNKTSLTKSLHTFLLTFFIIVGIACPMHLFLGLTPRYLLILISALGISGANLILSRIPHTRFVPYLILLGLLAFVLFPYINQGEAFLNALSLFLNGETLAMVVWSYPLTLSIILISGIISILILRSETTFTYVLVLLVAVFFPIATGTSNLGALWLIPLLIALFLSVKTDELTLSSVLLPACVILALSIALFPLFASTVPALSDIADQFRQTIDDYFFFTDARTPFSLATTGWQPLGANRLGGPVSPTEDKVMQVATDQPLLLRGAIRNEYNGFAWADTVSSRRYLFIDPRFLSLRNNTFDLNRPASSISSSFPEAQRIRILIESEAASTLYVTQRFNSPSGQNIVPYFSPSSELFATHTLEAGEQYDFNAIPITAFTSGIRDLVNQAAQSEDSWMIETIEAEYLSLPSIVEQRVYELAQEITANARTRYDQALAISTYLSTSFPYTYNQNVPPTTRDYVSWFLFEEQKGYCTAFASAMVVLARAVGIPARYIEGYSAVPEEDGIARVTQQNAHAWCELYFEGFGWLTFDPTPGTNQGGSNSSEDDSSDSLPTPTPTPQQSPTPTPDPQASDSPEPEETPTPEPDDGSTPTPEPSSSPSPSPSPTPEPDEPPDHSLFDTLILILILLLLVLIIVLRFLLNTPAQRARREKDSRNQLLYFAAAILQLLRAYGIVRENTESPMALLERADATLNPKASLGKAARIILKTGYSREAPSRADIARIEKSYHSLFDAAPLRVRIRFFADRFRRGLTLKELD